MDSKEYQKQAIELLKTLALIPAPLGKEHARAEFCLHFLQEAGADRAYIDSVENVICPIGNSLEKDRFVVVLAHSDTVFPEGTKLSIKEENGKIYCPGIGDDTANLAAVLLAVQYILKQNFKLKDLGVLIVIDSGEEGLGNLKGAGKILEDFGSRIRECLVFDAWNGELINRSVGSRRYRISLDTKGGHSYQNFGNANAIQRLALLVSDLYQIEVPDPETTYNIGMISGGTSVNTIAQHAELLYEYRSVEQSAGEYMEKQLQDCMAKRKEENDVTIHVERIGDRPMMGKPDPVIMQDLMEQQARIHENCYGRKPVFKAGSTDCNVFHAADIPAICIGCFYGGGAHTLEEYVEIASLLPGYQVAVLSLLRYFVA